MVKMEPERWRQIERLYYAALERAPDERTVFLAEACAGDESLRREVVSLIADDDRIGSFLEAPPDAVAAEVVAAAPQPSVIGQTLTHYRVVSLLGRGGMGEVYLGEDTTLGRRVALKLLPAAFTSDRARLRRFEQEARAASALNHPNIITIHEISQAGSLHYLVTEYIEGETLRQRITAGRMKLSEAVEMAVQVASAFELTQGQPYLANALAKVAVEELRQNVAQPITLVEIEQAKEILIERQETHLDSLAERLRESRVRQVIEPMLAGRELGDVPLDDIRFVVDLGLARMTNGSSLEIANPIYREVIPRSLAGTAQASLPRLQPTWLRPDGSLDPDKLLEAFLAFWRQHGQPLLGSAPYHEIAPHLVMMAFLHRVANAGGTLEREYAIGSGRMDLCLRYGPRGSETTLGIELKVWREGKADPLRQGLSQLDEYLSGLRQETGWLVIFDRRSGLPEISERTATETATTPSGRTVTVIRG